MAFHAGHEHRIVGGLEEDECRMSDATEPRSPGLDQLARDWITIWESELTALAADRESQETWRAFLALWARAASTPAPGAPASDAPASDDTAPAPASISSIPARSTAVAAASDARDAEIERLARRVAALESRLGQSSAGGGARRARKRKT